MSRSLVLLLLPLLLIVSPAAAQSPHAPWRTVETAHFRVHYPAASEAWAEHAAVRLESIREAVVEVVGYAPPDVIDVVIADPVARPNGLALPMLRAPRMVLWTSPPPPHSVIGQYRDWAELVTVHETVHLVHLLRPSRHPLHRAASRVLPVGPIPLRAPRWVIEGYATMVEGQLTGSGRPCGDLRAALLRRRAQRGELPSYGGLSSDPGSWQGMSMAYLAGSAFLEWLWQRSGPESLRHLWARMTARADRNFDDAFTGVFGDSPRRLYNRFSAELTYRALAAEYRIAPGLRDGELWQDLSWSTGAPALSPDGRYLAVVRRYRKRPSEIVVWPTAPDDGADERWATEQRRVLERDPEDVAAVPPEAFERSPEFSLPARDRAEPYTPRWMPDGRSLLYVRYEPDGGGVLHPDLFRWTTATGRIDRLTRGADVREPDPAPDGRWAVAVRHRNGLSQLVRVDLETGLVDPMTEPVVGEVCAWPRVHPDGNRVAYVRHRHGRWRLLVLDLADGHDVELPTHEEAVLAYPAWSADGSSVFVSIGGAGFVDVHAVAADGAGLPRAVTRTHGGALAPCPTPDGGAVFFLSLEADGLDLRRLDLDLSLPPIAPVDLPRELVPAIPPARPTGVSQFADEMLEPSRSYGAGRQELGLVVGGRYAPAASELELGVRSGDLLGRIDLLALGALAFRGGAGGGVVSGAWRGWPIVLSGQVFVTRERPSDQPTQVPGLGTSLDLDRDGVEIRSRWLHRWRGGSLDLDGGAHLASVETAIGESYTERLLDLGAGLSHRLDRGRWHVRGSIRPRWQIGSSGNERWRRYGGGVDLELARGAFGAGVGWERRGSEGDLRAEERYQLGGMAGSLLPLSARWPRVLEPALPAGVLVGREYEGLRAELRLGGLPLFYARHRLWDDSKSRSQQLDLVGIGYSWEAGPWPLLRLPRFRLDIGAAYILDEPLDGVTTWWIGLAWRP